MNDSYLDLADMFNPAPQADLKRWQMVAPLTYLSNIARMADDLRPLYLAPYNISHVTQCLNERWYKPGNLFWETVQEMTREQRLYSDWRRSPAVRHLRDGLSWEGEVADVYPHHLPSGVLVPGLQSLFFAHLWFVDDGPEGDSTDAMFMQLHGRGWRVVAVDGAVKERIQNHDLVCRGCFRTWHIHGQQLLAADSSHSFDHGPEEFGHGCTVCGSTDLTMSWGMSRG